MIYFANNHILDAIKHTSEPSFSIPGDLDHRAAQHTNILMNARCSRKEWYGRDKSNSTEADRSRGNDRHQERGNCLTDESPNI